MKIDQIHESHQQCPECGGPAFSDLLLAEKKDACYSKVRSRYKVWPSAYASGALVQCRKKGAANWGNKSKNEGVAEGLSDTQKKIEDTILKLEQRLKFAKTPEQWDNIKTRIERLQAGLNRSKQGVAEAGSAAQQAAIAISMKKAGKKPMNEYNAEYDDEAGMADNNLETLKRAVEGIDDLIQSGDNLPEWCQEKIANAKSMLVAVWDYMYSEEASDEVDPEVDAMFEAMDRLVQVMAKKNGVSEDLVWEQFEAMPDTVLWETAQYHLRQLTEDWQKVNKQDKTDGMSRKAVKAYRRENPGSKLKTAVTTKPSKLKKGGKAAKRRKSFCARMRGMKKSRASAKTKRNPNSPINKALRRWNC